MGEGGWRPSFLCTPLPPQHQLTLVFVMSAGEGHHVVFLAPSPSSCPSPNLSSSLTLILTVALDQGVRGLRKLT